ncbi:39S ribosomal protein L50, mitochondrial [Diabrotica virgifera virgifera]|uniref:Large ribosomal subunit protein mL50 n=1 Tax=Diabrotica virgifera virgifera TaxID=50390 RepID=A0A6P7G2N3_DIAVI|nr:39S ribosomal protein L50, mitochondrial [Diabrotica virgifera virgifera]
MAAFLRHGVFKTGRVVSSKNVLLRSFATKAEKRKGIDRKVGPKIDSTAQSLASKGFLRQQRDYSPPEDVNSKLEAIFQTVVGSSDISTELTDLNQKFTLFMQCEQQLGHSIPNSLLHHMKTLKDVQIFYNMPVDTRTPLERMKSMDLPENLHVQYEYKRFNADTDTMFGGKTAFPKSSTIVTGLKYKDKYKGQKQPLPDF